MNFFDDENRAAPMGGDDNGAPMSDDAAAHMGDDGMAPKEPESEEKMDAPAAPEGEQAAGEGMEETPPSAE